MSLLSILLSLLCDKDLLPRFIFHVLVYFFIFVIVFLLGKNKFQNKRLSLSLLFSHTLFTFYFLLIIIKSSEYAQFQLLWYNLMIIDLPVSLLHDIVYSLLPRKLITFWVNSVVFPFLFFLIFGSAEYYMIGRGIEILLKKKKELFSSFLLTKISIIINGILMIGLCWLIGSYFQWKEVSFENICYRAQKQAIENFKREKFIIFQLSPDRESKFTGKKIGRLEIWSKPRYRKIGRPYRYAEELFVRIYNKKMKELVSQRRIKEK